MMERPEPVRVEDAEDEEVIEPTAHAEPYGEAADVQEARDRESSELHDGGDDELRDREAMDVRDREDTEARDREDDEVLEGQGPSEPSAAAATPLGPGPDEQRTLPEDREEAAAMDDRSAPTAMDGPAPDAAAVATAPTGPAPSGPTPGPAEPFELFPSGDLSGFRERWQQLQASFVDDPKASAEQADAMVRELIDRLSSRHQTLHDELARRSDQGGDTEAMRVAIRQYRTFFETLVGS